MIKRNRTLKNLNLVMEKVKNNNKLSMMEPVSLTVSEEKLKSKEELVNKINLLKEKLYKPSEIKKIRP